MRTMTTENKLMAVKGDADADWEKTSEGEKERQASRYEMSKSQE